MQERYPGLSLWWVQGNGRGSCKEAGGWEPEPETDRGSRGQSDVGPEPGLHTGNQESQAEIHP